MAISDAIWVLQVMSGFKFYLNETRERLLEVWGWVSNCSVEVEERLQFDISIGLIISNLRD